VRKQAEKNLHQLYLSSIIIAPDSMSEDEWRMKLACQVGSNEANMREKRVRDLLQRFSSSTLPSRRAKTVDEKMHNSISMLTDLEGFVGKGSAARLVAAYFDG
jgi:hypothetical protein